MLMRHSCGIENVHAKDTEGISRVRPRSLKGAISQLGENRPYLSVFALALPQYTCHIGHTFAARQRRHRQSDLNPFVCGAAGWDAGSVSA